MASKMFILGLALQCNILLAASNPEDTISCDELEEQINEAKNAYGILECVAGLNMALVRFFLVLIH